MIPSTYIRGRPHTLLPLPPPAEYSPAEEFGEDFFYEHIAKPLIGTTVRLMDTGLPIDLSKVAELESEVDSVLKRVEETLESNAIVQQFYEWRYPQLRRDHRAEYQAKLHTYDRYLRPFDPAKVPDRSYYMYVFIREHPELCYDIIPPPDFVYADVPKWTVNDIKKILHIAPQLEALVTKRIPADDPIASVAMNLQAQHKADAFNARHDYIARMNADSIADVVPKFNPASSDHKHLLLTGMLGLESDILSDAYQDWDRECRTLSRRGVSTMPPPPKNKYSWSRTEIEKLLPQFDEDSNMTEFIQCIIDHSFAAIIRQNFIESFYKYTVDGVLYGQYKLLGAKSGRYTSSNP